MKLPHEMTSSTTEDRKIALSAVRDAELPQGIWIQFVIKLVMESPNPRALTLALILLKKYASWGVLDAALVTARLDFI